MISNDTFHWLIQIEMWQMDLWPLCVRIPNYTWPHNIHLILESHGFSVYTVCIHKWPIKDTRSRHVRFIITPFKDWETDTWWQSKRVNVRYSGWLLNGPYRDFTKVTHEFRWFLESWRFEVFFMLSTKKGYPN